jgi:hypothetical protein
MFVADIWLEFIIRVCVNLFLRIRSLKWPEVEGRIDASNVDRGITGGSIVAEIHYFYAIDGETFDNYFKEPYLIKDRAPNLVLDFPPESKTKVRVNPRDPSQSFLVEG